jgi:acetolactate synthase-1/2/3 large subunit
VTSAKRHPGFPDWPTAIEGGASGLEGGYFDPPIDLAREAEAAGAYGENVRDPGDVLPALRRGLERVRSGIPAVIAAWLPRLLKED